MFLCLPLGCFCPYGHAVISAGHDKYNRQFAGSKRPLQAQRPNKGLENPRCQISSSQKAPAGTTLEVPEPNDDDARQPSPSPSSLGKRQYQIYLRTSTDDDAGIKTYVVHNPRKDGQGVTETVRATETEEPAGSADDAMPLLDAGVKLEGAPTKPPPQVQGFPEVEPLPGGAVGLATGQEEEDFEGLELFAGDSNLLGA